MQRRQFLTAAAAAGLTQVPVAAEDPPPAPEYYELRHYRLRRGAQVEAFDAFHASTAVPAWNRAGVKAVGVFETIVGPDMPGRHVLLTHTSPDSLLAARAAFESDPAVEAAAFANLPATQPGYVGMSSTLLRAFVGQPRLAVPKAVDAGKARIFELRTYEAHSRRANRTKVDMFNRGELAIFRRCGLTPVFFGEALIGPSLPSLTYLLTFPDLAAREAAWSVFRADPEWHTLSRTPGLTDPEILTSIQSALLRPMAYSQI